MTIKGIEALSGHFPELHSGRGRLGVGLYFCFWFALVTTYFILSDNIPTWSIDSQILIMSIGFLLLSLFFSRKRLYEARYGERAYRNAVMHFGIPGLGFIFAAVAHSAYMNGPFVPRGWWTTAFLALGWWNLLTGAILWLRTVLVFGVDHLAMVYVYHPQDGHLANSKIHAVLRHPVYAGLLRVIFGLALLNGNANALAFIPFAPLGFGGWIRLVEERELIARFGETYLEYRKRVPAFWPRFRDVPAYLRLIFMGA